MTLPITPTTTTTTTTTVLHCSSNSSLLVGMITMMDDRKQSNDTTMFVLVDDNARSHSPPPAFLRRQLQQEQHRMEEDEETATDEPEFFHDSFCLFDDDDDESDSDSSESYGRCRACEGDGSSSTLLSFASYQNSFNSSCGNLDSSCSTITLAASNVTTHQKKPSTMKKYTAPAAAYWIMQEDNDLDDESHRQGCPSSPQQSDLDHTRHTSTSRWATDASAAASSSTSAPVPQRRSGSDCCFGAPTLPCRSHSPQQPNARRKTRSLATKDNPLRMIRRKNSTDLQQLPIVHRVFPTRSSSGTAATTTTVAVSSRGLDMPPTKRRFISSKSA